jgi:hypothetical protein
MSASMEAVAAALASGTTVAALPMTVAGQQTPTLLTSFNGVHRADWGRDHHQTWPPGTKGKILGKSGDRNSPILLSKRS